MVFVNRNQIYVSLVWTGFIKWVSSLKNSLRGGREEAFIQVRTLFLHTVNSLINSLQRALITDPFDPAASVIEYLMRIVHYPRLTNDSPTLQSEHSSLLSGNTVISVNMHRVRVSVQLPSAADTLWLCLHYRGLNSFLQPASQTFPAPSGTEQGTSQLWG